MTTNNAASTIIIGVGSPYGADQLGWQVVDYLKSNQALLSNSNIRLETCDRPGTLLLDYLKGVQKAILIDAIEGGTSGNVLTLNKQQLLHHPTLQSSHHFGVAETIALGEKLNLLPEELVMYGVETGDSSQQKLISMEVINSIANSVLEDTKIPW